MPFGRHEQAVLAFCHEGSGRVHCNGAHALQAGTLMLLPGWAPHRVQRDSSHVSWLSFREADVPARLQPVLTAVRLGARPVRPLRRWSNDLEELLSGFDPSPPLPTWTHQALRLVYQHLQQPWSLPQVANYLGLSPPHLTTQLRRHTGRSLMQWSLQARLELAALQLTLPDQRVADAAQAAGFNDLCHFRRCFRRRYRQSPQEYRLSPGLLFQDAGSPPSAQLC